MLTIRAAASLLADSASPDGLIAIARAVGFTAPVDALDQTTRSTLGLGAEVTDGSLIVGQGALRALILTAVSSTPTGASIRDLLGRLSTRLSARAPETLWLVIVRQTDGATAIATWHFASQGARNPSGRRVVALLVDRAAVVDSDADTLRALAGAADADDLTTHARWIDILGREALSRRFFNTFTRLVSDLGASASVGTVESREEVALLYASRLLFLAFVEAKGWLDGDRGFLTRQFDDCMGTGGHFHGRVLLPLFFGTLNTPTAKRARVARAFGRVPFLNGGLFTRTVTERRYRSLRFSDAALGALFGDLFARYRFTAREESTTFHEAAIDPEMLGRTFESLMASSSRRSTGSFYTPHELVHRVATTGLEDALASSIGDDAAARAIRGDPLDPGERACALEAVRNLTILDPACGSGAFLVHLLDWLSSRARQLGDDRSLDVIRREILTRSIFGVDLNPTAVWLCELRLWLAVVIEAPDGDDAVTPLPNLDRNIRVGDALAGPAFTGHDVGADTRRGPRRLRERYTRATGPRKQAIARELDREERRLVIATLDAQLVALRAARRDLVDARRGRDLFGERVAADREITRQATELRRRSAVLRLARGKMAGGGALPFFFPAHFADVATRGGFHLIVGNPPWVRPHRLSPAERERYRRTYRVARTAPWQGGALAAGAGHGFGAQFDVAALFVERSLHLLRPEGTMALLLPAKLWRSLSAGGMRHMLMNDAHPRRIEDYSDARAAFEASVYPGLLVARTRDRSAPVVAAHACVSASIVHKGGVPTTWRMAAEDLSLDGSPGAPWMLLPKAVRQAFDAVRDAGVTLAESPIGRAHLGVKCGLNEAFLARLVSPGAVDLHSHPDVCAVHGVNRPMHEPEAIGVEIVDADGRSARIERSLIRPVARGEDLRAWTIARDDRVILWTHDANGGPLVSLPPLAAKWFARWRRGLLGRTDARTTTRWWSLFRTEAALGVRPRVVWADMGRTPRASVLLSRDPIVPLNSCYVAHCRDDDDAFAFAALLNSPLASAWLGVLAEPARGGYRRFLGWTMSLLPLPAEWAQTRVELASIGRAATTNPQSVSRQDLLDAALGAYGIRRREVAPLLVWNGE